MTEPLSQQNVRIGQIWASTHNQDTRAGVRQRREVTAVDRTYAYLRTLKTPYDHSPRPGSHGIKLTRTGIQGHRLVEDAS